MEIFFLIFDSRLVKEKNPPLKAENDFIIKFLYEYNWVLRRIISVDLLILNAVTNKECFINTDDSLAIIKLKSILFLLIILTLFRFIEEL